MPTLDDQLEQDVRALRPDIDPAFEAALHRRIETGFAAAATNRRHRAMRPVLATMAVAASALVAVIVVTNRDDTATFQTGAAPAGGETSRGSDGAADPEAAVTESDAAAPSAGLTAPSPQSKPAPSNAIPQKVERAAQLALTTTPGDVQKVANGVVKATQSAGGRVTSSQVTTQQEGGSASFVLSIPTARLDTALKALSGLADVDSLSQDSRDITGGFVTAADRLSDARTERKAILRALGKASNAGQIATLRKRLAINSSEIARYKGDLDALRRRANLSTVEVTIAGTGSPRRDQGGAWTPADAVRDAVRVLEVAAGATLIALAVMAPLAALGLAVALAGRHLRRRRRANALAAA